MTDDDPFQAKLAENFRRRAIDDADLQNEIAGRDTGRQARFLPEHRRERGESARRREASTDALSRLQLLLQSDPAYAALYTETMARLAAAETATEVALEKAEAALAEAEADLETLFENAATLPDGTRIFLDAQGNVVTEDGQPLEGVDPDTIAWPPGAPGYEDVLARKQALEEARERLDEILHYQIGVLGEIRDRLTDPDNPPTPEELEDMLKRLEEEMPESVREEAPAQVTSRGAPPVDLGLNVPKL